MILIGVAVRITEKPNANQGHFELLRLIIIIGLCENTKFV